MILLLTSRFHPWLDKWPSTVHTWLVPGTSATTKGTTTPRGQIAELDGIRAIAIVLVLLCHFWPSVGYLKPLGRLFRQSWFGVDLFFVLSGFLIAGILLEAKGSADYYKNFYARRTLRIFPPYYAFLIVMFFIVVPHLDPAGAEAVDFRNSGSPWWYFFYLGNWRAAFANFEGQSFLSPLWSLAIEEHFYLFFPFLVATLSPAKLTRFLIGLWFFVIAFRLFGVLAFPENWPLHYMLTLSRMDGIALGALLAVVGRFWGPVTQYWKLYALAGVFLVGGDLALRFLHVTSGHRVFGYSFPSFAAVAFLVWTLLHLGQRQTAFLRFPGLTYIGKISYGVYLFHEPLGYVTQPLLRFAGVDLDAGSLTLLFARIAFSIAVASLSWFVFEKPILRLKGRFVTKVARRPAEAQPVATV